MEHDIETRKSSCMTRQCRLDAAMPLCFGIMRRAVLYLIFERHCRNVQHHVQMNCGHAHTAAMPLHMLYRGNAATCAISRQCRLWMQCRFVCYIWRQCRNVFHIWRQCRDMAANHRRIHVYALMHTCTHVLSFLCTHEKPNTNAARTAAARVCC